MAKFGYALSSEEHPPNDLVRYAKLAEESGFEFALISDHFHPWVDRQGQSPFVWSVIGAIAHSTSKLRLGTGVTCPTVRTHPAVIAQAAATSAAMMEGRFFLGVGSGENLNEHIFGDPWPSAATRLEMLEEAIEVIRKLWDGGFKSHSGKHYRVENARIYTLPSSPPEIYVAAAGEKAAQLAGSAGDGLIATAPEKETIQNFESSGGKSKPKYGGLVVCYAEDEASAAKTALEWWPNAGLKGELGQELPLPRHFEQAAELVTEEMVREAVVCGSDPARHIEKFKEYLDAGFDHVYVHQVGPDQDAFFRFYAQEVLPTLQQLG